MPCGVDKSIEIYYYIIDRRTIKIIDRLSTKQFGAKMKLKEVKIQFITDVATDLFLKRSINEVTIKDIATAAGVGEATVYRYFERKQNIVERSALSLQKKVYEEYFNLYGENGYEKIKCFYAGYIKVFDAHPEFYKFINEFDAYMVNETHDLAEYSEGLDMFKTAFFAAYRQGIADGSVRETENAELFYYTSAHALLSLCKKLAAGRDIVKQDSLTDKADEVKELIKALLFYVKKPLA